MLLLKSSGAVGVFDLLNCEVVVAVANRFFFFDSINSSSRVLIGLGGGL
jgi:hypothetical protein